MACPDKLPKKPSRQRQAPRCAIRANPRVSLLTGQAVQAVELFWVEYVPDAQARHTAGSSPPSEAEKVPGRQGWHVEMFLAPREVE